MQSRKIIARLREHRSLLSTLLFSLVLRVIWMKATVVRDEADGGYLAMLWSQGYPLYNYSNAVRPPLWYALYYVSEQLFGNSIIPIRIFNNLLFIISVLALFQLCKSYFGQRTAVFASVFYGVFMNMPAFEGQLAIPASLATPLIVISLYLCSRYYEKGKLGFLFLAGMVLASAFLILQDQAIGFIVALAAIWISICLVSKKARKKLLIKAAAALFAGFSVFLAIFVFLFALHGELDGVLGAMIFRIFTIYAGERPPTPFGVIFLIITEGLPLWLFAILGLIACVLKPKLQFIFVGLWAILALLRIVIPPHYPHHILYIMPSASIFSGIALASISEGNIDFSGGIQNSIEKTRKLVKETRKNLPVLFLKTILLTSFLPSIFLAAVQYPNTNMNWEFVHWNNSFFQSYDEQQNLADFLRTNAHGKSILIHDWLVEIYWLSGHRASNIYVNSYNPPEIQSDSFPSPEVYKGMVEQVKNGGFEYIVFGSWWREDEIISATKAKYFYITSIGGALVYAKYNVLGESEYYSFIKNFGTTIKDYTNQSEKEPVVKKLSVNGDSREAIFQHPPILTGFNISKSYVIFKDVLIPNNATLRFGIAIDSAAWNKTGDGVQFEIFLSKDEAIPTPLFSSYIDPKLNPSERKWNDIAINLTAYSNTKVVFYFATNCGPSRDANFDWAYWANPVIFQGR